MSDNIEDRALELIKSKPKGILQSELWKDLEIDSRKCSRVVAKLEAEGKVKRTWETVSGTRTYRLSYVQQKKEAPKKEYRFDLIMADDEVAPCVGCTYECEPDYCPDLGIWIELLAREESRRPGKPSPQKIGAKEVAEPEEGEAAEKAIAPKAAKAGKAKKAAPPEEEVVEEVKPVRKGKAAKAKKVEEEPEEVIEEVKPAKKGKAKPAPEEKEEKKAPARKRK